MTYEELYDFIVNRMRMSHIYQPVMLITLLQSHGRCKDREIASSLLSHDQSQIEYYTKITNNMVGRVLRDHNILARDSKKREYEIIDFDQLTDRQIDSLIEQAKIKLLEFVEKRGADIYRHRRKSPGYISGTLRYEVLKRARFRCELCGISADEKALEVDHIIPKNLDGSDDLSNLQSLCYSCNAMKRDRDATDFRRMAKSYADREEGCVFCDVAEERILFQNELCVAVEDSFPVTERHTLVIPRRHVASYFDLGQSEINAANQLLEKLRQSILDNDPSVAGFNIGVNSGEAAGQTIFHCHIHQIPRRLGDVEEPRGGVRNVVPGRGNYTES